ncbi:hypothetical protein AVEN_202747-1, partial [Araneus ventricosus]
SNRNVSTLVVLLIIVLGLEAPTKPMTQRLMVKGSVVIFDDQSYLGLP